MNAKRCARIQRVVPVESPVRLYKGGDGVYAVREKRLNLVAIVAVSAMFVLAGTVDSVVEIILRAMGW